MGKSTGCERFFISGADAAKTFRVAVGAVLADARGVGLFDGGFVGSRRDAEDLPAVHGVLACIVENDEQVAQDASPAAVMGILGQAGCFKWYSMLAMACSRQSRIKAVIVHSPLP